MLDNFELGENKKKFEIAGFSMRRMAMTAAVVAMTAAVAAQIPRLSSYADGEESAEMNDTVLTDGTKDENESEKIEITGETGGSVIEEMADGVIEEVADEVSDGVTDETTEEVIDNVDEEMADTSGEMTDNMIDAPDTTDTDDVIDVTDTTEDLGGDLESEGSSEEETKDNFDEGDKGNFGEGDGDESSEESEVDVAGGTGVKDDGEGAKPDEDDGKGSEGGIVVEEVKDLEKPNDVSGAGEESKYNMVINVHNKENVESLASDDDVDMIDGAEVADTKVGNPFAAIVEMVVENINGNRMIAAVVDTWASTIIDSVAVDEDTMESAVVLAAQDLDGANDEKELAAEPTMVENENEAGGVPRIVIIAVLAGLIAAVAGFWTKNRKKVEKSPKKGLQFTKKCDIIEEV